MAGFSDSNSKVSVLVSLTEGKNHADLVLMGDTFGGDFVKEYKSPKVIMAKRKARSTEGNFIILALLYLGSISNKSFA